MPQYLLTIQLPDDFDPSTQDEAVFHDMEALAKEMEAAGVVTALGAGVDNVAVGDRVGYCGVGTNFCSDMGTPPSAMRSIAEQDTNPVLPR